MEGGDVDEEPRGPLRETLLALGVRGYACEIFDDATTAWRLHREDHLIRWQQDDSLRVDRYDARNLLHDRAAFRQLKRTAGDERQDDDGDAETHALLQELRFADLRRKRRAFEEQEPSEAERKPPDEAHDMRARVATIAEEEPFVRPPGLRHEVQGPTTHREHEIIEKTAFKTRGNAALEIVMKTKFVGNPQFGFLNDSHELNAYYMWLRDGPEATVIPSPITAVRLLGDEYGQSDEDDGPAHKSPSPSNERDDAPSPQEDTRESRPARRSQSRSRERGYHYSHRRRTARSRSPNCDHRISRRRSRSRSRERRRRRSRSHEGHRRR